MATLADTPRTLDAIRADLAELETIAADLESQQAATLAGIAENLTGDTSQLETQHTGLVARLRAIPKRRADLQAERAAVERRAALDRLESLYQGIYERAKLEFSLKADITRAQNVLDELNARQRTLRAEITLDQGRIANLVRKHAVSVQDHTDLLNRWAFVDPDYPNYAAVMKAKARRGHLPPGAALSDFGIEG